MGTYDEKIAEVWEQLGDHMKAVLATGAEGRVSARTMSFVVIDRALYFQTDHTFRKARDIAANPNVAVCADNVQIEGTCRMIGAPADNEAFCRAFKEAYPSSFEAYSDRSVERLYAVEPAFIQRWVYRGDEPVIERYYCDRQRYTETAY